jgi:hypothetical protein
LFHACVFFQVRVQRIVEKGTPLLKFSVEDNGVGIDVKTFGSDGPGRKGDKPSEQMFGEFVQAEMSDTRAHQGLGLGLALARALVVNWGGRLWLPWSEPGVGSTFAFTVPVDRGQQSSVKRDGASVTLLSDVETELTDLTKQSRSADMGSKSGRPSGATATSAASNMRKVLVIDDCQNVVTHLTQVCV